MIAEDMSSLLKLFEASDLTELSIEQRGRRLYLRKGQVPQAEAQPQEEPQPPASIEVKAHMVGIFYWTNEKTGKPTVTLHQHVEKGQVIGLIEAMGILNEVEAPEAGEVVEIAIAAGQPVEYGQPLVTLL